MNTNSTEPLVAATWLTRKEAAAFLRLSPATLANWASMDVGPSFTRLGAGRTFYRREDLDSWMQSQNGRAA